MVRTAMDQRAGRRARRNGGHRSSSQARVQGDAVGRVGRVPPDRDCFLNRELSWLQFNDRVLQLAEDPSVKLLERVKFCAIYASNLDEFCMIRIARLFEQRRANLAPPGADGATPDEVLRALHARMRAQGERLTVCFEQRLKPALAAHGLRVLGLEELNERERAEVSKRFNEQIFPVLSPLAIGLGRRFPYISNLSLSLAVMLRDPVTDSVNMARVKVPKELLSRFITLSDQTTFIPLEDVIAYRMESLFPGMQVLEWGLFRVTCDADFTVGGDTEDLLKEVQNELEQRRFGDVVRIEIQAGMPQQLRDALLEEMEIDEERVHEVSGMLDLSDLWTLVAAPGFAELRDPPWTPVTPTRLLQDAEGETPSVMAAMRRGNLIVHHPYDGFAPTVERYVTEAVDDQDVLAIKQTVHRPSDTSPLVPALIRATERGKQAVCMVEFKARFDEQTNIQWALSLEEAGVHVVYGIPGLKTHAKAILVLRREGDRVRHYVHVGTGNYNSKTARLYTDLALFTTDPELGADVADVFNFLTGFARPTAFRKLLVSPISLREGILEQIRLAATAHSPESPSRILMKMNALVDPPIIRALYDASRAGVRVELNVRGICALRPGVSGASEYIRVAANLGRSLELSLIYHFA